MSLNQEQNETLFSLKTPYLKQGTTNEVLATADMLGIIVKVYAQGGENRMHQHPEEEHSFVILEGQATFHFGTEGNTKFIGPLEGVLLPRGVPYRFESSGETNLVMLRVGAMMPGAAPGAFYPDGMKKSRDREPAVKRVERIELEGPGFGG